MKTLNTDDLSLRKEVEFFLGGKICSDLMVPINNFPTILEEETIITLCKLYDNLENNKKYHKKFPHPVLVINRDDCIVGKVGPLACLKALFPNIIFTGKDMEIILRLSEFHSEYFKSLFNDIIFTVYSQSSLLEKACKLKIKDIMFSASNCIDCKATLSDALSKINELRTLSIFVTFDSEIVGLLSSRDIYRMIPNNL